MCMEFVCKDVNGNSTWYYENGKYFRKNIKGEIYRSISGEQLPDPVLLWEKRQKMYPEADKKFLRPQDATFCLYEHWNKLNERAA